MKGIEFGNDLRGITGGAEGALCVEVSGSGCEDEGLDAHWVTLTINIA